MRRRFTLLLILVTALGLSSFAQVTCHISASVVTGCSPLTVNFTDQSTGNPTSYTWDFDQSGTNLSNAQNPSYIFTAPGIYNVKHIISNGSSTDSCVIQIRVYDPPNVGFISADNRGCNNPCHTVNLTNVSAPGSAPIVEFVWNFGDGSLAQSLTPPQANTNHCYSTVGSFSVTLIARDTNGCQTSLTKPGFVKIGNNPTATVTVTPAQSCTSPQPVNFTTNVTSSNGAASFEWYFGNGGTSVQQNPTQVYLYGVYDPLLIVSDTLGCSDSIYKHVEIIDLQAGFKVANTNVCRGLPIAFTDTSNFGPGATWSWNFGDGGTSTQHNPSHIYTTNGTFTVSLTVTYAGCTDTETKTAYINVTDPVQATFTASDSVSCSPPLTVNFTGNVGGGATGYNWNFGDGGNSTQLSPSHTYTTSGLFTVTLSVSNAAGCVNNVVHTGYIDINTTKAKFKLDSLNGCAPLTVTFTDQSTTNSTITNYSWTFGDGGTSTVRNPVHTYTANGDYSVTLAVTDANGCTATYTYPQLIHVGGPGAPNFNATPRIQCVHQPVNFNNLTTGVDSTTTYLWDFGDSQTSTDASPTHEYSDIGNFSVTLTVISNGCSTIVVKNNYIQIVVPKAIFSFQFDCNSPTAVQFNDSSQGAQTWFWDFGDGTTSTQQNPLHNFPSQNAYDILLIVTNSTTGCVDSLTKTLPIGTPAADFGSDTTIGCIPKKIFFSDSSVFASTWLWNFGDGGTSTLQNPNHNYTDTGRYTVTLIINPGQPCSDTIVKVNYITAIGVKAGFAAAPPVGCTPVNVLFTDTSSSYMGNITNWTWSFGDGDSSYVRNPSHTYSTSNTSSTFVVRLTVKDNNGCSATKSFNGVKVYNPIADFTSDSVICPGESLPFTNLSTGYVRSVWYFGDGGTSTSDNPTHVYTSAGQYTVSLVVYSNSVGGCPDSIAKPFYLYVDTPLIDFQPASSFAECPPFPVKFTNTSNRKDLEWLWHFGDGDTSTAEEPLHVYLFPGDYTVTLIGTDTAGCTGSKTYVDLIRIRGPIGNFTLSTDSGCVPINISISGTTISTVSSELIFGDGSPVVFDTINTSHIYTDPGTYFPTFNLYDSAGCKVAYEFDTLVVGAIPYPNLPDDTSVCKGNYVQFPVAAGDHFIWTSSNPTNSYLDCDTCQYPTSSSPDTITYYVTAISNLGCSASDTITMNVDPLPPIFPGISFKICPTDTLQLTAGAGVTVATWSPNLYITDTTSVNPYVFPPDSMTYRVTGSNHTGCSISRIVKVYVIDSVRADVAFADTLLCEGGTVQLSVNVIDASYLDTAFYWTPAAHLNSSVIVNPLFNAPHGDYDYQVVVSSRHCVPDTGYVHITVAPKPSVEAGDDQTVAVGTTVQLYAASPNPVDYFWTPAIDSFTCTDCRRPYVTVTQDQVVYATAINQYGCSAFDSVILKVVNCDPNSVFIPNTFTPNNDDLNDKLYVRGIGLRSLDYFRVFDRWGRMVFETKNLNEGWDGTVNGKPADVATYVYLMKGVCSSGVEMEKSGNVTLLR